MSFMVTSRQQLYRQKPPIVPASAQSWRVIAEEVYKPTCRLRGIVHIVHILDSGSGRL
jgi:hypothetical protein